MCPSCNCSIPYHILSSVSRYSPRFVRQRYFAGADKVGKFLANYIKKRKNRNYVTKLVVNKKDITDHNKIKEAFVNYFENFYKGKQIEEKKIQDYLAKFVINPIPAEIKRELNKEITVEEIIEVIKDMKLNKSPGPDGFTAIFYKKFKDDLAPVLKELFTTIMKQKNIPTTWNEAYITLIPKEQQ